MKKHHLILKKIALITAITLSITASQAQNNFTNKKPETFKEKILKKKEFRKISSNGKKSMSRGNHTVPSEIINLAWGGTDWDTISKSIITYNAGTDLASEIIVKEYTGSNTFINNNSRIIKKYDQFNNLTLDLGEVWNSMNNTWESSWKTIDEFDSRNNPTFYAFMLWNDSTNQWDTRFGTKSTYTYNTNGDILTIVLEIFNDDIGDWEILDKKIRNYNSNGFWISTISQFYNGTTWENEFKEEYSVNTNGEWTEAFIYSWDGSAWVSDSKLIDITWYNFADFKLAGYIFQSFNGVFYVNEQKYTGTYHTNGDYLLDLFEVWNGTGWENSFRMYNVYDSKDNITESMVQEWILMNWIINDGYKAAYSYDNDDKILNYEEEFYNADTETWEDPYKYIYLYNTSVFSAGVDVTICYKDSTQLYGSGGTIYNWSPITGLSCSNCSNPKASPQVTTEYVVTVTNGPDSGTDTVVVNVDSLPVAVASMDEDICFGSSINLSASGGISYTWHPATGLNNPNISSPLASPATTTTYTVTVTDENNCADQEEVTIEVNDLPVVSFNGLASNYCTTNPAVDLNGNPSGGTFNGPGITNNQFDPSLAGEGNHIITYTYTDLNNCINSSSQNVAVEICTGIKSTTLIADFSIHPNPSKGVFILSLSQAESKDVNINITNILGQKVFSKSFKEDNGNLKEEIDLTEYEQGIYLMNIIVGTDLISKKIIIE